MRQLDPAEAARAAVAAHPDRPATALIHDTRDVRLVVFRIAPGQAVPSHTSKSSVVLQVVSGAGLISGPEVEMPAAAGAVIAFEPGEEHGMRSLDSELVILATITPRPGSR